MIKNISRLKVYYNNKLVGFLEELPNGRIGFQYDVEWIQTGFSISPLQLPLGDAVYISKSEHFGGLFGVFYDSLPDGWGELLVRRFLAKNGIDFDLVSVLVRLSLLSSKGLGALTYEPTQRKDQAYKNLELDEYAKEIELILSAQISQNDFDTIYQLGGASGGTRPKIHILESEEEWIVKFPSSMDPKEIGALEYESNTKAKQCGIRVNEYRLFPSSRTSGYFGAKRFDRFQNRRMHVISLSALLETTHRIPNLDYTHLFQVIQRICIDQEDMYEAYRRMCFNVLYGNKDDHGKNFAFLYDELKKGYVLSPFYDITKTEHKLEHEMTVLGVGNPSEHDLLDLAKYFNLSIKKCSDIIIHTKKCL